MIEVPSHSHCSAGGLTRVTHSPIEPRGDHEPSRQAPLGCSEETKKVRPQSNWLWDIIPVDSAAGRSTRQLPASCKHCLSWLPFIWKVWQTMADPRCKHVSSRRVSSCTSAEFVQKIWAEGNQNALWHKINHYQSPRELHWEVMGFAKPVDGPGQGRLRHWRGSGGAGLESNELLDQILQRKQTLS